MPDPISDVHVIDFGNKVLRRLCDILPADYAGCKTIVNYLDTTPGILPALLAADPTAVIADGSPEDSRRPYTAGMVLAVIGMLRAYVAAYEANDSALLKIVNTIQVRALDAFDGLIGIQRK